MFKLYQVLCMLPVAMTRFSSGSVAIRYLLRVFWMTSHLHVMAVWYTKGAYSQWLTKGQHQIGSIIARLPLSCSQMF